MNRPLYSFTRISDTSDDSIVGLIEAANKVFPGFISLVIDGGAGVGSFTDRVLEVDKDCRIVAFEPLPENAAVLRSRFGESAPVDIRETALGDRATSVSFQIPERAGHPDSFWVPGTSYGGWVSRSGLMASLLPIAKRLAKKVLRRDSPAQRPEIVSVRMVRLDSELNGPPDLIKFDLQGGEPEAMDGLGRLLTETKVIKIEVTLKGAMAGQGAARTRCVRALHDAGFCLFVDGFQFAVPQMTEELRRTLTDLGMTIEREVRLPPQTELTVIGTWPSGRPLPIESHGVMGRVRAIKLAPDFAKALSDSRATYFCIDLIALNTRYAQQWNAILPTDLIEQLSSRDGVEAAGPA